MHSNKATESQAGGVTIESLLSDVKKALQSSSEPDWNIILTEQQMKAITPATSNKRKNNRREESQASSHISILHHFAKEFPVNSDSFVKWLIQTNPFSTHLTTTEALYSNYNPFLLALQQQNDRFVKAVMDYQSKEALAAILKPTNATLDEENCLHLAIDMESQFTLDIIEICQLDSTIFQQGDKQQSKNTPLHCAVIHTPKDLNDKEKQRKVVDRLIQACHSVLLIPNGNGDTPYQARIRTLKEQLDEDSFQRERSLGFGLETGVPGSTQSHLHINNALSVRPNISVAQSDEARNSAYEDDNYEGNSTDGQKSDEDHANPSEDLIFKENKEFRQMIIDDPILSLIRDYCIRNLSIADAASALYHATQGTCAEEINL